MTILLVAGTREARQLAGRWPFEDSRLIASLAGATREPASYACETRSGGFGGVDGLTNYLRQNGIKAVIDASHPFAEQISRNAAAACETANVPRVMLRRLPWRITGAEFGTLRDLAETLPADAMVLLTTGRGETAAFAARTDVRFLLRSIDPPEAALPAHIRSLLARPLFTVEGEIGLMRAEAITHLVTKNAGGERPAKLTAAETLGIPILSVVMPPVPAGDVVSSIEEVFQWVAALKKH